MAGRFMLAAAGAMVACAAYCHAQEPSGAEKNWTDQVQASARELLVFEDASAQQPLRLVAAYKWSNPSRRPRGDRLCLLYVKDGRPVASCKVYPTGDAVVYTPISFTELKLVTRRGEQVVWSPPKSPIEFTQFRATQEPHASKHRRTLQLKSLAREFSARTGEGEAKRQSSVRDLRLLTKSVFRYEIENKDQAGIIDGAVFVFVANGGNPQLFLIIEAIRDEMGAAYWQFGFSRRTIAELQAYHKKQEVWSVAAVRDRDLRSAASFHRIRVPVPD